MLSVQLSNAGDESALKKKAEFGSGIEVQEKKSLESNPHRKNTIHIRKIIFKTEFNSRNNLIIFNFFKDKESHMTSLKIQVCRYASNNF